MAVKSLFSRCKVSSLDFAPFVHADEIETLACVFLAGKMETLPGRISSS